MINLGSLTALIRTLRATSGLDAAAAPVAKLSAVAAVAAGAQDDAGAMSSTALRSSFPAERASATLDLTVGARVLQAALRGSGRRAATPAQVESPMPLTTRPLPAELADGLAKAIAQSGLFYESHLARALERTYPIAAVSREPQAGWAQAANDAGAFATTTTSPAALPEAVSSMLSKQLDVLETRSLIWTGELWPGQRASIALQELPEGEPSTPDSVASLPSPSWRLRLTLDMPSLGPVTANVDLCGDALRLMLATPSSSTQSRLSTSKASLAAALASTNVGLAGFEVVAHSGA